MDKESSLVATYDSFPVAELAIKALQAAGLDTRRFSIVGREFHNEERVIGLYSQGDRMIFWGAQGAAWGSLWGILVGGAFFFVPTVGPVLVMGPLIAWIAGAIEGAAVGGAAGVLGAALLGLGIPSDTVYKYETAVKAGKFLILSRGPTGAVAEAREILSKTSPADLTSHPVA